MLKNTVLTMIFIMSRFYLVWPQWTSIQTQEDFSFYWHFYGKISLYFIFFCFLLTFVKQCCFFSKLNAACLPESNECVWMSGRVLEVFGCQQGWDAVCSLRASLADLSCWGEMLQAGILMSCPVRVVWTITKNLSSNNTHFSLSWWDTISTCL